MKPTTKQLRALGCLLHMALKEIRILSLEGKGEQSADLADAMRQLPLRMFSQEFEWQHYEKSLNVYRQCYPSEKSVNYARLLEHIRDDP